MIRKFAMLLCSTLLIALITACVLPRQPSLTHESTDFKHYIEAVMAESTIPGLAIAVIKNNQVQRLQAYGYANIEQQKPLTIDTPFNVASISKPILGISLLKLQEQGLINIDEDINHYLPFTIKNPKVADQIITLRHLANHTSGLKDAYQFELFGHNSDAKTSLFDYVAQRLASNGQLYQQGYFFADNPAGSHYRYSNLGAALAGLVLESATHVSLDNFSQEYIFGPLAMENTAWELKQMDINTLATPYRLSQCIPYSYICSDESSLIFSYAIGALFNPPTENKTLSAYPHYGFPDYPAGGLRSSIKDLTILIQAIMKQPSSLLSRQSYQNMLPSDQPYFFWQQESNLIGHRGSNPGTFTYAFFEPKQQNAIIVLMNRGADALTVAAFDKILQKIKQTDYELY